MQAGVEIIPLEPDQRSDLRREAPSVTLTFPPPHSISFSGWGVDSGIADVLSLLFLHQQQLGYKQVRRRSLVTCNC